MCTRSHTHTHAHLPPSPHRETLTWLKTQQGADGCFRPTGMVHNSKVRGGYVNTAAPPSSTAITAFVLAALLEAGESKYVRSHELCSLIQGFHTEASNF